MEKFCSKKYLTSYLAIVILSFLIFFLLAKEKFSIIDAHDKVYNAICKKWNANKKNARLSSN